MPDPSDPFPKLRAAYLRAIAKAWRTDNGENYAKALETASKENLSSFGDDEFFKHGVLGKLCEDFQLDFPFKIKLKILSENTGGVERPVWERNGTSGWLGCSDVFKIYLPAKPALPANEAEVLGKYLQLFPSMLGSPRPGAKGAEAPPSFAEFGVITGRLIALSWYDLGFGTKLFSETPEDKTRLVEDAMGCMIPWNFKLEFAKHVPEPVLDSSTDEYWEKFPPTEITLYLPQKPTYINVQAIALAAYNATGPQYPFTCG